MTTPRRSALRIEHEATCATLRSTGFLEERVDVVHPEQTPLRCNREGFGVALCVRVHGRQALPIAPKRQCFQVSA